MLENYPHVSNCKTLKNFNPPFRLRIGNYRALFDVEEDVLTVYNVKERKKNINN